MATEFILDADTAYDHTEQPPVPIRVDGKVYQAYCPKDSLPLLMARLQDEEEIAADPGLPKELVHQILLSTFDEEDAAEILARLLDMSEKKITLAYVMHIVGLIADHYKTELDEHYQEMGVHNPLRKAAPPANRQARRAEPQDRKSPARKTAAKRAAASKG